MSEVFVSTDARRACPRDVIKHGGRVSQRYRFESHRGEWALFFPSCRQLYLSSFSDTNTHTHCLALFSS